ncbi:hypothetical protein SADUNF_Sadunf16G0178600 [Salix dunnii]|uniref:Uncharacterized protein n=1 Tax=Salix dunnii TaxID=1413687 RepID=A0A835JAB2_9ROSI|nr:hypothetical protein SADUNF_Sadunf16G0178600 [Salix dunnii]
MEENKIGLKKQQTNRWERCSGNRVLGFRSLKKRFNDVGFAIKFKILDLVKINNFFRESGYNGVE